MWFQFRPIFVFTYFFLLLLYASLALPYTLPSEEKPFLNNKVVLLHEGVDFSVMT